MKLSIERANGTVFAPPSKSALHRRLILNAIAGCFDAPEHVCLDAAITANALFSLQSGTPVDCGESGSTLRFLLPVSTLFGGGTFSGSPALSERPIRPLIDALRKHGASISSDSLPLSVSGRLSPGRYELEGGISSQFFSGLLMTLPFLSGDSMLLWSSPLSSRGYVDLTERMLEEHGIAVSRIENGFSIPGRQSPFPLPVSVEGDWSCAAPMLILGAMLGSVTVTGLNPNSDQPDKAILDVLLHTGAHVAISHNAVTVSKGKLSGCKFNGDLAPDLVPALAALGCASVGDTVLYGLSRLRFKESNRFDAILKLLRSLGADFETERTDTIVIHGHGVLNGGTADLPNDHRMVMAAALMSAVSTKPVIFSDPGCVRKSYPDFFADFSALGGRTDAI